MENQYDIFISYRREGGAQYARILQLALQQRGYRVFLDYDELTDGIFSEHIKNALKSTSIFMLILSKDALDRCVNENDWLRQEILIAIKENKQIIPVNPDDSFNMDIPEYVPEEIKNIVRIYQHSEVSFGQTLGATVDLMIKHRIDPILGRKKPQKTSIILVVTLVLLITLGAIFCIKLGTNNTQAPQNTDQTRTELHLKYRELNLYLDPSATLLQLSAVDKILENMTEVVKDSLWMSQFELTCEQWYNIQNVTYESEDRDLPIANVSYGEINLFIANLSDLTNLNFSLPSVEEWIYAAKGGSHDEKSIYVGSNNPDDVAWYMENSGGVSHPSNGQQGKEPNMLDLFDMSGNVSELCKTPFDNDPTQYTICGGNYNSDASELTTSSRSPFNVEAKDATVGFRIVLHKNLN